MKTPKWLPTMEQLDIASKHWENAHHNTRPLLKTKEQEFFERYTKPLPDNGGLFSEEARKAIIEEANR